MGGCIINGCLIPEFLAVPAEREGLKVSLNFTGPSLLLSGCDVLPRGLLLNTRPQACVHPLTSLGGPKMLGQFICGSVWWQHVPDVPSAPCSDQNPSVLCGLRLVNDLCCIVCSRLLMWVAWQRCWWGRPLSPPRKVKHPIIVLHLPKPPPQNSDPWPTADICNHHLNLLVTMQIL